MSSPIPLKRRRLNDATGRLSKPFVSPLRTSRKTDTSDANLAQSSYMPSTLAHTVKAANPATNPESTAQKPMKEDVPAIRSTPARKQPPVTLSTRKKADPEELILQKACNALEFQIKKVQNDIDALQQASKVSNSSTDADLEGLTDKWRLATQAVAEELFGSVKERVCRMGGVAAWREMEKRKYDRSHGLGDFARVEEPEDDDADCEFDSEGEELPEDEQEYRKKMKRQALKEMAEAAEVDEAPPGQEAEVGRKTQVWAEAGKDDDTFTMDMMLRSLNIDLGVIGYDKDAQRWMS